MFRLKLPTCLELLVCIPCRIPAFVIAEGLVLHLGAKEDILTYKSGESAGKQLHGTVDDPLI